MSGLPQSKGHREYLARKENRIQALKAELTSRFPDPGPITLEIGCGHGHYLTAYAGEHPEEPCLGIDLVTKRIEKAILKGDKRNLANLHFIKAEVNECFMAWPAHLALGRIFVLFPDPWPKKRHVKNRILQPGLLDQLARHAHPGARLHFRTDHPGNFAWGSEVIGEHPSWTIQEEAVWPLESPSYFQDLLGEYQSLTAAYTA